jgi:hypothetical protein
MIFPFTPGSSDKKRRQSSQNIYRHVSLIKVIESRMIRCPGHVARMGEIRNTYKILVEKPEGKTPLRKLTRRREYNSRISLRKIGWEDVDWINLAQDRDQWRAVVNTVMSLGFY